MILLKNNSRSNSHVKARSTPKVSLFNCELFFNLIKSRQEGINIKDNCGGFSCEAEEYHY